MKLLPATNFGRLVLLIGGVLAAILIIALLVLREVSLSRGGEQIADLMARQVIAARALERYADRTPAAPSDTGAMLELRFASKPPETAELPRMVFLRQVQQRLLEKLGPEAEMRIDDGPPTFLWIRDAPNQRWVGIASPEFRRQAVMLTIWVSVSALLLVLAAAGLYARSLSRPLERLAAAAGEIAKGAFPSDASYQHATREIRELESALQQSAEAVRSAGRERELLLAGVSAYVVDGFRQDRVRSIMEMAVSRFNAYSRLERELEDARSALAGRDAVDKAKRLLMKTRGVDENAAYTLLRTTAMNQNRKIAEVAESLLMSASLLGGKDGE